MALNPNGSRFQLLNSQNDWLVDSRVDFEPDGGFGSVAWDAKNGLTLKPLLSLFPTPASEVGLAPESRRGVAADAYGNWYWISSDRRSIYWIPRGSGRPAVYWSPPAGVQPSISGAFGPALTEPPATSELAGLVVTEHQYLVVGDVARGGLFRFDLRAGGEPLLILLAPSIAFAPFDMAATPGGGFCVLDRSNRGLWGIDRDFRVVPLTGASVEASVEPAPASSFGPVGGEAPAIASPVLPAALALEAEDPIAIDCISADDVLVLGRGEGGAASVVSHYRRGELAGTYELQVDVQEDVSEALEDTRRVSVSAYDFVYEAASKSLYVAADEGKQVIALGLDLSSAQPALQLRPNFLPLHFFGRRGLALFEGSTYYDVIAGDPTRDGIVRFVKLQDVQETHYDRDAVLLTPVWDGKERDCVWDRVFLDACIPPDTTVLVASRASNEPDLIDAVPFSEEPPLYLRSAGAEIPYYDPYADQTPRRANTGTWEVLLQRAQGRYLQVRLTLGGTGHSTPSIRALRAYHPRFSYPRRYLPSVYLEDSESVSFIERFLANPEGFYTEIEAKVRDVPVLFDARSAPPDALDWLGNWVGVVLDPIWEQLGQRRRPGSGGYGSPPIDRRRLMIRYALRLFARRGTPDGVRLALHLLLDPYLEECLDRIRNASVLRNEALAAELQRLGITYPTPTTTESQFEDLMLAYLLAPSRPSKIRLVERFLTRGGRAAVEGDATADPTVIAADEVVAFAHRFSVLIPEDLSPPEVAMVSRLVELEKPAHTLFDVRRYWDYFLVGSARLGTDTVLGDDSRFGAMVLGQSYVSEGYLSGDYPQEETDRVVLDRDGPFSMPPL